jgi:glycerophosphoryl diester phosphodiesterase
MWVKKTSSALIALLLAASVVAVLSGPTGAAESAAHRKCNNIAHRAMWKHTEEQVRGIRKNSNWGFSEIDARVTADNKIVALHDFTMERPTGGKVKKAVGSLTLKQIRGMRFVLGRRVEKTRKLIQVSANRGVPVMVTINSYTRYKDQWDNGGLAALWAAAQLHPNPSKVYFGGPGGERAMRDLYPEASTFHRYSSGDMIFDHAIYNSVTLAAVPPKQFNAQLVKDLRAAGVRVATTQLERKRAVRRANKVGIRLVQTDRSRRTVREWCR